MHVTLFQGTSTHPEKRFRHHGDDDLVRDDDEIAAAIDVADGHEVGIDHASQLDARGRLADDAQAAHSIMSIQHRGGGDQVDSLFRSTSMKLLLDCLSQQQLSV